VGDSRAALGDLAKGDRVVAFFAAFLVGLVVSWGFSVRAAPKGDRVVARGAGFRPLTDPSTIAQPPMGGG